MATDPISATFNNAASKASAQSRGALAALANGGTEGLKAYNNAQSQMGGTRQAALQAVSNPARLIGGSEAALSNYSGGINSNASTALSNLNANRSAFGNGIASAKVANADYFKQLAAAAPVQELALARAQANAAQSSSGGEAAKEAQIAGSVPEDIQNALAQNKKLTDAQKATVAKIAKQLSDAQANQTKIGTQYRTLGQQEEGQVQTDQNGFISGYIPGRTDLHGQRNALSKQIDQGAANIANLQQQLKQAQSAKLKLATTDPFEYAQREAMAQGYTREQASALFGPTSSKGQAIYKATPEFQTIQNTYQQQLLNGKNRGDFDKAVASLAASNPTAARLIISQYRTKFPK